MPLSPSRSAAFDILMRVEQGAFADELLHSQRLGKLSTADRALCTEIVMGVLRWRSLLDDEISVWLKVPPSKLDAEVATALRIGTYQMTRLDRVPSHAAVDQSVELVKRSGRRFSAPIVNAVLRKIAAAKKPVSGWTGFADSERLEVIARATAHPLWLVERWALAYGVEAVRKITRADQQVPLPSLRISHATAESDLRSEGIDLAPGALLAGARRVLAGDVTKTQLFTEGRVHVQDEASQLVAFLVGTGSRLLDCCAAPGGKTSIMAERSPSALVVAVDLHPGRTRLMRRLVRARNVAVIAADATSLALTADFDRVLVDAPCSGTGTLSRNPEIKWRLRTEDLADLHGRQVGILRSAINHLAPGGRLVYSTCSLEREENEDVIAEVTQARDDLRLLDCRDELKRLRDQGDLAGENIDSLLQGKFLRTIPGVHPCDGFFAAMIERLET